MSAYAEEMDGLALHVWVNPSRNIKNEFFSLQTKIGGLKQESEKLLTAKKPDDKKAEALAKSVEKINKSIYEWYANIWSQATDPETHVTVEEIEAMVTEDPAIWAFMARGTQALISEHSEGIRKN